ncbi:MAG TPA: efflux RND transporter periplasmic adaptor subunit [Thermoanaerobaculia bacterium]
MKRALILSIAIATAIATAACSGAKQKPAEEKVPVSVATAEQKDVPVQIRVIGNVAPVSTVQVRALVGGQLERVWFKEGDEVQRGQRLFTIDPRPYEAELAQAKANLARDEANQKNAEAERARYADLVKKDYVTHEDFDRISAGAESARAVVAADRAAIQNAELQLSYCDIRSPLDGRTGQLVVHQGNLVKANDTTALVVINQVQPVNVQFAIPERQLADLRARGFSNVPVSAMPQGAGMHSEDGKLSFVDNTVDATTGTINLKASFPNADRALWPGQYVNVAVTLSILPGATVIPAQAVQNGQHGQYVYVVKNDQSVDMRPVNVVQQVDQNVVVNKGVQPGESVVTDGQLRLTPKSHVEIKGAL